MQTLSVTWRHTRRSWGSSRSMFGSCLKMDAHTSLGVLRSARRRRPLAPFLSRTLRRFGAGSCDHPRCRFHHHDMHRSQAIPLARKSTAWCQQCWCSVAVKIALPAQSLQPGWHGLKDDNC